MIRNLHRSNYSYIKAKQQISLKLIGKKRGKLTQLCCQRASRRKLELILSYSFEVSTRRTNFDEYLCPSVLVAFSESVRKCCTHWAPLSCICSWGTDEAKLIRSIWTRNSTGQSLSELDLRCTSDWQPDTRRCCSRPYEHDCRPESLISRAQWIFEWWGDQALASPLSF